MAQVLHHAAGDQHAWASFVGSGSLPAYDPFSPPQRLDDGVEAVVEAAVASATAAWAQVDPAADAVRTPLPPVPALAPGLAAAACALDAAVHAWDVAVATGQPSPLIRELAEQLLPAARATAGPLRGFAYGPARPAEPGRRRGHGPAALPRPRPPLDPVITGERRGRVAPAPPPRVSTPGAGAGRVPGISVTLWKRRVVRVPT